MHTAQFLLFFFLLFSACTKDFSTKDIPTIDFSSFDFDKITLSMDEYVETWKKVVLETSDSCLLDPSYKFYPTDGTIIAYSYNRILTFDNTGKFLREISHFGQGPEEHGLILDCIGTNDGIILFTEMNKRDSITRFDSYTNRKLPSIPIAAKKPLINIRMLNDSVWMCFPYMGNKKQIAYRQDSHGQPIAPYPASIEEAEGPYTFVPLDIFRLNRTWYYRGIYEDTVYTIDTAAPSFCFRKGKPQSIRANTEVEDTNSLFLNTLFSANNQCILSRIQYTTKEVADGLFESVIAQARYFLFDYSTKKTYEIDQIRLSFTDPDWAHVNTDVQDLLQRTTSLNPEKLVIILSSGETGKGEEQNPVLLIGDFKK